MQDPQYASQLSVAFPPEIWGYITYYLSGEQIGRLKMTGSNKLWKRLSDRRSVKTINFGKDHLVFKRWPAFVNELSGVEELEICNEDRNWWISWRPKLSQVPRTLRKLKIWSDKFLFDQTFGNFFVGSKNECLSLCDYVPELEVLQVRLHWNGKYPWMKRTPPNLKSLIVQRWTSTQALPASLTHLEAHGIVMNQSETFRFPPQLESISAFSVDGFELLMAALPPSIASIDVEAIPNMPSELSIGSMFLALPSTVTKLHGLPCPASDFSEIEPESFVFPLNLKSYKTSHLPVVYWTRLPKTLQTLALSINLDDSAYVTLTSPLTNTEVGVYVQQLHTLPESLTVLELSNCTGMYFAIHPAPDFGIWFYPPNLASLDLAHMGLTVEAAKLLPASLRHLRLSKLDSCICEHLPRSLESLDATKVLITPTLFAALPKNLKFLKFDNMFMDLDWVDPYTYQTAYTSDVLSFISKPEVVYWEGNAVLPQSLTSLELIFPYGEDVTDFNDTFATQHLPNLTYMSVRQAQEISDSAIPHLSRNLRLLNISRCNKVTGKCFPYLPKSLTELAIFGNVHDEDIQHLPSSLVTLRISSADSLTPACIAHLPKQLETLSLRFNDSILQEDLPKTIILDSNTY